MTTPSKKIKIEPTQILDEDLKDRNPKTMRRRFTSAIKKSFSRKRTPSKTYIFNTEEDFKDRTKFSNRAGVGPKNTVFWSIILKIDPANINPKITYTDPELKEAVTRVLRFGKTLDRKYGEKGANERNEVLADWQKEVFATYLKEKGQKPEIRKALELQDSKNVDGVIDEIQLDIDADESIEKLTARLKKLGGRSRRRQRRRSKK
jgi:hypothetical protein